MSVRRRPGCWLKGALLAALLFLLTQTPFIYHRYQLGRLAAAIQQFNAQRAPLAPTEDPYADYAGVLHVHSALGGHSTGTLADIVRAARASNLAFVVMTEHPAADMDTAAQTLRGWHGGVLFIPGSETSESADDRLLTFGADAHAPDAPPGTPTQELIDRAKQAGQLVFVAHPETFRSWQTAHGFDGMEVYNLHADARHVRPAALFFDGLWSYRAYPHLLWTRFAQPPVENLRRWDEMIATGRKVVAVAGNDAHQNVGLSLQHLTGRPIIKLELDPYERSFQVVRTHVILDRAQPFDTDTLLAALAAGHAYVAFDLLCDAGGFRLTADNGQGRKLPGDEIALGAGVRLRVATPVESRIVLVKDGQPFDAATAARHEWTLTRSGVYRVECYLPQLGPPLAAQPWIISNPVYVR
ncbi:MAG TPA: CehA/McbA family metallohydrolase [Pyrinomonadaceae bacterium]